MALHTSGILEDVWVQSEALKESLHSIGIFIICLNASFAFMLKALANAEKYLRSLKFNSPCIHVCRKGCTSTR